MRLLARHGLQEMTSLLEQQATNVSLVYQRIIAILAAAINSPRLLMIDEPTYGLDEADAGRIISLVKHLSELCSVIIVLHKIVQT